jgi:outer membrane biosynthesis protein TonB
VDATAPPAEQPAPAPASAKGKGKGKATAQPAKTAEPAPAAKQAAKAEPKPAAQPKPTAKVEPAKAKPAAVSGNVIRVIAEEKPGQYELVVQTSKPPASFTKMFLTDPPRLVLDIAGTWTYKGATTSDTGDAFIRHVRVGVHPDLFRVVLDMSPDAPAKLRGAPTVERVPEGVLLRIPK